MHSYLEDKYLFTKYKIPIDQPFPNDVILNDLPCNNNNNNTETIKWNAFPYGDVSLRRPTSRLEMKKVTRFEVTLFIQSYKFNFRII
jgi:hypothetical protein